MERKIDWQDRTRGQMVEIDVGRDWLRLDVDRLDFDGSAFFGAQMRIDGVSISTYVAHEDIEASIAAVRARLADLCAPRVVGRFNDLLARLSTWEAAA